MGNFYLWLVAVFILGGLTAGCLGIFRKYDDMPPGELDENIGCAWVFGILLVIVVVWGVIKIVAFEMSLNN